MTWINNVILFYKANQPLFAAAVGAVMVSGIYLGGVALIAPRWRGMMIRKERREYVHVFLIDKFVSDIEDAVSFGDISREEASEAYRDLKKCFPIKDLYPSVETLKENILSRQSSGVNAPVDLPRPKRRNMMEKAS